MSPEEREQYRPVDSTTRDPAAPYRCAEMREDADRVLLGRAHPDMRDNYHAHRLGCSSCQEFHRIMRAAYEGPGTPPARSSREDEFHSIVERAHREAQPDSPQRRLMWLAPVAAAAALLLATFGGADFDENFTRLRSIEIKRFDYQWIGCVIWAGTSGLV